MPIQKADLDAMVVSDWKFLLKSFPRFITFYLEMNKNLKDLSIDSNRNEYLFGWMFYATKATSLFSIQYHKELFEIDGVKVNIAEASSYVKSISLILDILVDDIGDKYQGINSILILDCIKNIIKQQSQKNIQVLNAKEVSYINFFEKVYNYLLSLISFNNDKDLILILTQSYLDLIDACKLSHQINYSINNNDYAQAKKYSDRAFKTKSLDNKMHVKINTVIDLFFVKKTFTLDKDISRFSKVAFYLQRVSRLSNDLSTWEREVWSNDFTSTIARLLIFKYGVRNFSQEIDEKLYLKVKEDFSKTYKTNLKNLINLKSTFYKEYPWFNFDELIERYIAGLVLHIQAIGKI